MVNLLLLLTAYLVFVGTLSYFSFYSEKRKKVMLRKSIDARVREFSNVYKN